MRRTLLLLGLLSGMLAGCGGGGGGGTVTLYVLYSYPAASMGATLRAPMSITPTITGLSGHTPHCKIVGGALPSGVALSDSCQISGTPLAAGNFSFTASLTADGVQGSVETSDTVIVLDPTPTIGAVQGQVQLTGGGINQQFTVNQPVGNVQVVQYLIAPASAAGDVVTYALASGALPAGLTLDTSTGNISGTPTSVSLTTFSVTASLLHNSVTYTSNTATVVVYVSPPNAQLSYPNCPAVWTQAWSCTPTIAELPAGASVAYAMSFTPDGYSLAVDPATGVLSGNPSKTGTAMPGVTATVTQADGRSYAIGAVSIIDVPAPAASWGTNSSDLSNMTGVVTTGANRPILGSWFATVNVTAGQPFTISLVSMINGLPGDRNAFSMVAWSVYALPTWISVDAATGTLSGTAPTGSVNTQEHFYVHYTVTRNGLVTSGDVVWSFTVQ